MGVLLGQAGGFAAGNAFFTGASAPASGVALGDVNGDGRLDLVTVHNGANTVGVLLGQAGGFATITYYALGAADHPYGLALGDVNGDGRLDIVTANFGSSNVSVLLGQAGGFAAAVTYDTGAGSSPNGVALGDINGDGYLDIVTANNGTYSIGVLLGQRSGFAPVSRYASVGIPLGVALGDINGDGRLDLVATTQNVTGGGVVGVLLGQPSGVFAAAATYPTGGQAGPPASVALGDVNGDGRLDIVSANFDTHGVGVLLGQTTGLFAPVTTYSFGTSSLPNSIALGDLNGDGNLDIVAADQGTSQVDVLRSQPVALGTAAGQVLAPTLLLYPTPAREQVTLQLATGLGVPTQADLLNLVGQVVRQPALVPVGNGFRLETAGLAPGTYTLRLRLGEKVVAQRVVLAGD